MSDFCGLLTKPELWITGAENCHIKTAKPLPFRWGRTDCIPDSETKWTPYDFEVWHYQLWSFKLRDTKLETFLHKINLPKGNYWILRIGLSSLQKSELLKLIISFFHYFWCQHWNQWRKMSEKNPHIQFFYFWFKNKWFWVEKIGKKWKKSKNLHRQVP